MSCAETQRDRRRPNSHGRSHEVTPLARSRSCSATFGCGRCRTRSFSPRCWRGCLLGRHAIRRQVSGRYAVVGGPNGAECGSRSVFLGSLIAADNLLWRVASWIANYAFVGVTGDLRRDLFRHLTGHSPGYFADRLPGMLTSRITATSNAVFTAENMLVWNVLPPCVATVAAIGFVCTISLPMAAALALVAGIMVVADVPPRRRRPAACITISPTRPPRSTAKWSTSSPICRWCGRSAACLASIAASTPPSIAK